ncbi:hypothetical protein [Xanthobacter sp. KR7-225]|uniref:hypothetical protein n=1 Tax=Xanthobacter sp. KR7-225 TaxID=3156613 RepID=UPI0032B33C18
MRQPEVRIAEEDAGAPGQGAAREVRRQAMHHEHGVGRIGPGAETVVRHSEEGAVAVRHQPRHALHRLARERRGKAADRVTGNGGQHDGCRAHTDPLGAPPLGIEEFSARFERVRRIRRRRDEAHGRQDGAAQQPARQLRLGARVPPWRLDLPRANGGARRQQGRGEAQHGETGWHGHGLFGCCHRRCLPLGAAPGPLRRAHHAGAR